MIENYFFSIIIFCLGLWGLLVRRNLISTLVCLFMLQLSIFFILALLSNSFSTFIGEAAAMYGVLIVLAWASISLGVVVYLYRKTNTLRTDHIDLAI